MKIVIVTNSSGGLCNFRKMLIEKLLIDNEVVAYTPFRGSEDILRKVGCIMKELRIDRRGTNPIADSKLVINLIRIFIKEKPDLVITYTIKPNIYAGFVCRLLKIPYAANITGLGTAFERGKLLETATCFMYKVALRKAKVVFFENDFNRQLFIKKGIVKKERTCRLMGAGVDLNKFSMLPYPTEDTPFHFLFIGRIMKEKGIEELLAATKMLVDEGYDLVLDILGRYEENYKELIDSYSNEGWLHYHGLQKDVRPFIQSAHCFVLPSYHEGMANTNLENAASGRPVITSDIPGCNEAIIAGISGLTCEPKNVKSLYRVMKQMISYNNEDREKMGLAGREHMEKTFDKEKVVQMTLRALGL